MTTPFAFSPGRMPVLTIKTILHPTDFSEPSDLAFRLACSLARDHGARLVVAHVIEPPVPVYGGGVLVVPPPQGLKEPLRAKLLQLRPPGETVQVEHRLAEGDAATEILDLAEQARADLIVMGTHGRGGLRRVLMGSVAEEVVRKAPCPVLTVRTPSPEASVPAKGGESS